MYGIFAICGWPAVLLGNNVNLARSAVTALPSLILSGASTSSKVVTSRVTTGGRYRSDCSEYALTSDDLVLSESGFGPGRRGPGRAGVYRTDSNLLPPRCCGSKLHTTAAHSSLYTPMTHANYNTKGNSTSRAAIARTIHAQCCGRSSGALGRMGAPS